MRGRRILAATSMLVASASYLGPAPAGDPAVPAATSAIPESILESASATAPAGLKPADLQSAYAVSGKASRLGSGQTVAIVDAYDDPHAGADMNHYRQTFGLPLCTSASGCFKKLNQLGQTSPLPPRAPQAWAGEISLDLDMVSAICPLCHIDLVEAQKDKSTTPQIPDSLAMYKAERAAFNQDPAAVSNSWAAYEYSGEKAHDPLLVPTYPNTAVVAASGDQGYGVEYPAADPAVISVGGTVLSRSTTNARGWNEKAWPATGSGCSHYESRPFWQPALSGCGRETNDVSAVAQNVAVYDTYPAGGWLTLSGTSVATPIIAALIALAGGHVHSPKQLYGAEARNPKAFHDIVSGSNGNCGPATSATYALCHAVRGYDGPTGLGSPNGIAAFRPPA